MDLLLSLSPRDPLVRLALERERLLLGAAHADGLRRVARAHAKIRAHARDARADDDRDALAQALDMCSLLQSRVFRR